MPQPDRPKATPRHNGKLAAARRATLSRSGVPGMCMSRRELAEAANAYVWEHTGGRQRINLSEHDIGRYERGEVHWPNRWRRLGLRGVLAAKTDAELGFYPNRRVGERSSVQPSSLPPGSFEAAATVVGEEVEETQRRQALGVALGLTGAAVLGPPVSGGEASPPRRTGQRPAVDAAAVDHFARLRALLVDSDNQLGPAYVLPTVRHELGLIAQVRRQARGTLHDQLVGTEARWAEFAGWLCDDLGDHEAGTWWLCQAVSMAQEAGDVEFCAYLFARMAQRSIGSRDEDRVLGLAQVAVRMGTRHRHVQAFAILQQARGYAAAGETHPFESAIDGARSLVEDHPAPPGELGQFCTVPYVMMQEGEGWLRLKRPETAMRRFRQALEIWPTTYQRDRGVYLARTAAAQLDSGQPDDAAATALEALELAEVTRSARIMRELIALGRRMAPLSHIPAVDSLIAALDEQEEARDETGRISTGC